MTTSTNAMLAYGYDLGGDDSGWKVREAGEYGALDLPWLDDEDSFQESAEYRLLAEIAGFTERWYRGNDGYFDREREAKAQVGVKIDRYCHGEVPMYLLATKIITVRRGDCETIDVTELAFSPVRDGWDDKLAAATRALGITPTQERPQWLLVSYWG